MDTILNILYWASVAVIGAVTIASIVIALQIGMYRMSGDELAAYSASRVALNFYVRVFPIGGVALTIALVLR